MMIRVLGSSHHLTPPSRLQEAVSHKEEVFARLVRLHGEGHIRGALFLATCNRLEVVLDIDDAAGTDMPAQIFGKTSELPIHDYSGADATRYLLRVATGLESMVRGEDQILGQLRGAFKQAHDHGMLSPVLNVLRTELIAAARDTRRRTGLTRTKVSVAALAARQLDRVRGDIAIIGAGETGRLAIETLIRRGARRILVVNRTVARAEALAQHFGLESCSLEQFRDEPKVRADIRGAFVAVHSDTPVLAAQHLRDVEIVVDASMPCVLDTDVRDVDGLEVLDLDAIARLVQHEDARRTAALATAEDLVTGKARVLHQTLADTGHGRKLSRILERHMETAMREIEGILDTKLRHLSDGDRNQVREAMIRATKHNAHLHLKDVRELSGA